MKSISKIIGLTCTIFVVVSTQIEIGNACSFAAARPFYPEGIINPDPNFTIMNRMELYSGLAENDTIPEEIVWNDAPNIKFRAEVSRASYDEEKDWSCMDTGVISISIELDEYSDSQLEKLGVVFSKTTGNLPDIYIPEHASIGWAHNGVILFSFPWLDSRPTYQKPINGSIEISLITSNFKVTKPFKVNINSN